MRKGPKPKAQRNRRVFRAVVERGVTLKVAARRFRVSPWRIWYIVQRAKQQQAGAA